MSMGRMFNQKPQQLSALENRISSHADLVIPERVVDICGGGGHRSGPSRPGSPGRNEGGPVPPGSSVLSAELRLTPGFSCSPVLFMHLVSNLHCLHFCIIEHFYCH